MDLMPAGYFWQSFVIKCHLEKYNVDIYERVSVLQQKVQKIHQNVPKPTNLLTPTNPPYHLNYN